MNAQDDRQSTLINAMRFPLMVMVLFIHSPGEYSTPVIEWSLDGWNVYHFTAELLSGHLCAIATRCFFLFSGFLFFRYLKDGEFGLSWILSKWKKRTRTLLIPFLLWNLLMVAAIFLKNYVFGALALGASSDEMATLRQGPLYLFFTGPADFPLWYIRDLMLMSLTAPLLYFVFKRMRWISLALLILLYFSPLSPSIPSLQALFFFGLGAWMGIHKTDFLPLCRQVRIPAAISAILLLPLAASQVGRPLHLLLFKCFIPVGIITFVNICYCLTENNGICDKLCALSGSVFFIYAVHEIYILGWTKGLCLRLFGDSLGAIWIRYFLVPILVLGICLVLYRILDKLMPKVLSFACGGRS